jgi:polyribonucleotide nucleotidyltransferase
VLVARLVDRPLRPMFAKGWCNDTQVLQWVLSYDGTHEPEPLAITAASAALLVSGALPVRLDAHAFAVVLCVPPLSPPCLFKHCPPPHNINNKKQTSR